MDNSGSLINIRRPQIHLADGPEFYGPEHVTMNSAPLLLSSGVSRHKSLLHEISHPTLKAGEKLSDDNHACILRSTKELINQHDEVVKSASIASLVERKPNEWVRLLRIDETGHLEALGVVVSRLKNASTERHPKRRDDDVAWLQDMHDKMKMTFAANPIAEGTAGLFHIGGWGIKQMASLSRRMIQHFARRNLPRSSISSSRISTWPATLLRMLVARSAKLTTRIRTPLRWIGLLMVWEPSRRNATAQGQPYVFETFWRTQHDTLPK